jgi:hypothetical protein
VRHEGANGHLSESESVILLINQKVCAIVADPAQNPKFESLREVAHPGAFGFVE